MYDKEVRWRQLDPTVIFFFVYGLNYGIPCHSFICRWIRIASIVLRLVLESLPTHVNEVDQSGRVFCLCLDQFTILFLCSPQIVLVTNPMWTWCDPHSHPLSCHVKLSNWHISACNILNQGPVIEEAEVKIWGFAFKHISSSQNAHC